MNIFWGVLGIVFGTLLVIKTEWFVQNFGSNAWAEEHLGTSGGTRIMYKFIGIAAVIIAMMAMTGLLGPAVLSIFGGLFGM